MRFKITYNLLNGEKGRPAIITGPEDATIDRCVRVLGLACGVYKIDMSSLKVKHCDKDENRAMVGFLHPILAMVEGREAPVPISDWYF